MGAQRINGDGDATLPKMCHDHKLMLHVSHLNIQLNEEVFVLSITSDRPIDIPSDCELNNIKAFQSMQLRLQAGSCPISTQKMSELEIYHSSQQTHSQTSLGTE
jgi:hypothetical protein